MNDFEDLSTFEWDNFGFGFEDRVMDMIAADPVVAPVVSEQAAAGLAANGSPRKASKRKFEDVNGSQSSLEAQVKQLRNELKKTEKLRERLSAVEEQNALMRTELKHFNTSPQEIKKKNEERIISLLKLIRGFNSGDVETMRNVISIVTSSKCSILTPSLFQELRGKNAVIQFFAIMLETFPDGFFELSETELEESGVVISKFTFTGTKISPLPSDMLYEKWKDLSLEDIYKKRAASRMAGKGSLQATFLNIRSAPPKPAAQAAAVAAAAQALPQGEITSTLLECMVSPQAPAQPVLENVKSVESVASEPSVDDDAASRRGSTNTSAKPATEEMNRIIFVWNTTSLLGQIFGFSDGDLEVLNGVVSATQGKPSNSSSGGGGTA